MRLLLPLVTFLLCLSCSHSALHTRAPVDAAGLADRVLDATVHLEFESTLGSGFFCFAPNRVCTAWHVVDALGTETAIVTMRDGRECGIDSVSRDPERDIAVLKVTCTHPGYLRGDVSPKIGRWVMAGGHPMGSKWHVTDGLVSGHEDDIHGQAMFAFTAPVNPGNSGGPIVDAHGHLVGVVNAIRTRTGMWSGQGFGTEARYLRKLALD